MFLCFYSIHWSGAITISLAEIQTFNNEYLANSFVCQGIFFLSQFDQMESQ